MKMNTKTPTWYFTLKKTMTSLGAEHKIHPGEMKYALRKLIQTIETVEADALEESN